MRILGKVTFLTIMVRSLSAHVCSNSLAYQRPERLAATCVIDCELLQRHSSTLVILSAVMKSLRVVTVSSTLFQSLSISLSSAQLWNLPPTQRPSAPLSRRQAHTMSFCSRSRRLTTRTDLFPAAQRAAGAVPLAPCCCLFGVAGRPS